ncbi:MAG: hypothetical protein LBQ92_01970 [Propionibacteriaceae bacterium]|jgi:hypothetical protein|nr:hypothetical protein [Propionibacteriaceae bacterium]
MRKLRLALVIVGAMVLLGGIGLYVKLAPGTLPGGAGEAGAAASVDPATIKNDVEWRQNATMSVCEQADGGWRAAGSINNPESGAKDVTVVVTFTNDKATVLDRAQTTVTVDAGGEADWEVNAPVSDDGVNCVLRGVSAA